MNILLIGLNHRTAPLEVREQLAFSRDGAATALLLFRNQFPKSEAAIISTCNRVELIVASEEQSPSAGDVVSFIAQARDLPVSNFRNHLYELSGEQACRHFFRVASGLDSMVLGENQIVHQVKQAYSQASEQGTIGRVLNRLFHQAFEVSKRIRSETRIGEGKVSVPSVAVDVARKIFEDFSNKQTLVVGAGEMAQLVCEYLHGASARNFVVTTRTLANARVLADAFNGAAVPFSELDEQLARADIVITATACPTPFITPERIRKAQHARRGRLLFMIDLSVPRNIDPAVGALEQVYVYDVDRLGQIVQQNQQQRAAQLQLCEQILDEEVVEFDRWVQGRNLGPFIEQLQRQVQDIADSELQRLIRRCPDLTDEQRELIEQLIDRMIGKLMHPCICTMREHGRRSGRAGAKQERRNTVGK